MINQPSSLDQFDSIRKFSIINGEYDQESVREEMKRKIREDNEHIIQDLQVKNQELMKNMSSLNEKVEDLIRINLLKYQQEQQGIYNNEKNTALQYTQKEIKDLKHMFNELL